MVNTFLVNANFRKSASLLDKKRLGKQRVEAYQILCIIWDLKYLGKKYDVPYDESVKISEKRYGFVK